MKNLFILACLAAALVCIGCSGGAANIATNTAKKIEKDSDVPRISVSDAKKEVDAGRAVIVDSRSSTSFDPEHIAGAINIPIGSPATDFDKVPKGKKIIVYCS